MTCEVEAVIACPEDSSLSVRCRDGSLRYVVALR